MVLKSNYIKYLYLNASYVYFTNELNPLKATKNNHKIQRI